MSELILSFVRDRSGATAIEYGLIAGRHRGRHHRRGGKRRFQSQYDLHERADRSEVTSGQPPYQVYIDLAAEHAWVTRLKRAALCTIAQRDNATYFSAALTKFHIDWTLEPKVFTAPTIATATPDAIVAYSIEVAAESSCKNRTRSCMRSLAKG